MTHGMYAIYNKNVNLVAQTADTPAAFAVANQWVELPLTTPYTVPSDGIYYFVDLLAATTIPGSGNLGFFLNTSSRSLLPGETFRGFFGAASPYSASRRRSPPPRAESRAASSPDMEPVVDRVQGKTLGCQNPRRSHIIRSASARVKTPLGRLRA
jgi:hypothetical protein